LGLVKKSDDPFGKLMNKRAVSKAEIAARRKRAAKVLAPKKGPGEEGIAPVTDVGTMKSGEARPRYGEGASGVDVHNPIPPDPQENMYAHYYGATCQC